MLTSHTKGMCDYIADVMGLKATWYQACVVQVALHGSSFVIV
jgi:hypothetical protein